MNAAEFQALVERVDELDRTLTDRIAAVLLRVAAEAEAEDRAKALVPRARHLKAVK